MTHEQMVKEFMLKHGQYQNGMPSYEIPADVKILRMRLIAEEVGELFQAIHENDPVKIADALADLDYVVTGTAIAYGIPHEKVFEEVHRSNMTKPRLNSVSKGGKIEKEGYTPPNLEPLLFYKPLFRDLPNELTKPRSEAAQLCAIPTCPCFRAPGSTLCQGHLAEDTSRST